MLILCKLISVACNFVKTTLKDISARVNIVSFWYRNNLNSSVKSFGKHSIFYIVQMENLCVVQCKFIYLYSKTIDNYYLKTKSLLNVHIQLWIYFFTLYGSHYVWGIILACNM